MPPAWESAPALMGALSHVATSHGRERTPLLRTRGRTPLPDMWTVRESRVQRTVRRTAGAAPGSVVHRQPRRAQGAQPLAQGWTRCARKTSRPSLISFRAHAHARRCTQAAGCAAVRFMSSGAEYDVAIIGGGPGGYVAAIKAAQLGLKTVDSFSGFFLRALSCGSILLFV